MKHLWQTIKSWPWVRTIGFVVAGALVAFAAERARKVKQRANRTEDKAAELLTTESSKAIQRGKDLVEKAQKDKDKAVEIRKAAEERLARMGEENETLDSIADRFNSKRVRKSIDTPNS